MSGYEFTYVQGMNVLAAPFLYTMPTELEAYHCFKRFIEVCCPLYVQPTLAGVHRGLQLLDHCFEHADPELFGFLRSKNLSAEIYAFPCESLPSFTFPEPQTYAFHRPYLQLSSRSVPAHRPLRRSCSSGISSWHLECT